MEEIDIVELFERVKEGKAPKRILINGWEYCYEDEITFGDYYRDTEKYGKVFFSNEYDFRSMAYTKIEILDKPIIEELDPNKCYFKDGTEFIYKEMYSKINEIIRHINKENKE